MTSYLLKYDRGMLGRFLEMQKISWKNWGKPTYFINGAPMFVNRRQRTAQSCDAYTIRAFATIHDSEKEVIILN